MEMAAADISGAFLHAALEKPFHIKPPVEYRKPGVVWKAKRYLYGDKRAPRGWQDPFETTMLDLGFERLESEPGCFVKKEFSPKDTIIVVVHVDDLLSVGKRKHVDNFFVQLEKTLKLKRAEYIENGKSVLFMGDCITKYKDKVTLKSKDAYVHNMLAMLGMVGCKTTNTPMVRKESAAHDDQDMLEGSEAETYRSIVGIVMYFKRHRFDLHHAAKTLAMASSSPTKGHMRRLKSLALHSGNARHASGIGSTQEQLAEWLAGVMDRGQISTKKRRSATGGLLMLGRACVAGWSRTQKPTAMSSGESEIYSATVCACELLWACECLRELGYTMTARLKEDASACIGTATRLGPGRLKHVEITHFALQHWVRQGRLTLHKVTTTEQLADIMTKPFSFQTTTTLDPRIGLAKRITDRVTSEGSNEWIRSAIIAALSHQIQ